MKKVIHRGDTRGLADHGWLNSRHTFSFAGYHNPERMQFGLLRVLNDDVVQPKMGFGTHSHDNMEIVSIPLSGTLAHKDSMGHKGVIKSGEVQIMSAGTGLTHSEYNASDEDIVNFLQIWVFPKERDIKPRYDQKDFSALQKKDGWTTIVSPTDEKALWVNQDVYFSLGEGVQGERLTYESRKAGNGAYIFLIDGQIEVDGETLNSRDALGVEEYQSLDIKVLEDSKILLIDVPMGD